MFYNLEQADNNKAVWKMDKEVLELYIALSEEEKEAVDEFISSLLKNESYCPQALGPRD